MGWGVFSHVGQDNYVSFFPFERTNAHSALVIEDTASSHLPAFSDGEMSRTTGNEMFKVGSAARCLFIHRGFISAVYFMFFCGTHADLLTAAGIYRAISEYRHDARSLRWSLQTHLGRYVCTYIYIF